MAQDELDTLRVEAAAEAAAAAVEAAPPPPEAEVLPPLDEGLAKTLGMVVYGVSRPVCRKVRVTYLDQDEADMIGRPLAQLAAVYDMGPKDPKAQAWIGLGLSVAAVAGARQRLPEPEPAVAAPTDPMPPPKGFGDGDNTSLGVATTSVDRVPGT